MLCVSEEQIFESHSPKLPLLQFGVFHFQATLAFVVKCQSGGEFNYVIYAYPDLIALQNKLYGWNAAWFFSYYRKPSSSKLTDREFVVSVGWSLRIHCVGVFL